MRVFCMGRVFVVMRYVYVYVYVDEWDVDMGACRWS